MSKVSNKEMKYLLSESIEGTEKPVFKTPSQLANEYYHSIVEEDDMIPWETLREATWEQTSITQDMRRMSTQRLMNEIRSRIETIAMHYTDLRGNMVASAERMWTETSELLERYRHMGALQDYQIGDIRQEMATRGYPATYTTLDLVIVPTATIERINMEIRLSP
jgi:hypothetical protein